MAPYSHWLNSVRAGMTPALRRSGRLLLAEGRIDEALRDAQEAVRVDPQNVDGHYLLGTAQAAKNDVDSAATSFATVLRLNPRAAAAQLQLARIALLRNSLPSAIQLAEQATALQPGNLAAQLVLARSLVARGDLDRATSVTLALVAAAPEVGVVQTQAGMLALARADKAVARAAFEKALSLDGRLVEALSGLVSLDLAEKAPQAARARIEQRLQKTPHASAVLALAGRTWAATGDMAKGEEFLRRAIDADPSNLDAYSSLGGAGTAGPATARKTRGPPGDRPKNGGAQGLTARQRGQQDRGPIGENHPD